MNNKSQSKPYAVTLGLDLDGVISDAPQFFSAWTHSWPGRVVVVTYRNDRHKALADLELHCIRYDEVILVSSFEAKAQVIRQKNILVFIDDQPEILKHVDEAVHVMLFRNEGNFDFHDKRWILSNETGKLLF